MLSIGNRSVTLQSARSVAWTVFVEVEAALVESVTFGPVPPFGEMVTVREGPFEVTREADFAHLQAVDCVIRIVVCFANGSQPATFRHELSLAGTVSRRFECDQRSGQCVLLATLAEDEPAQVSVERSVRSLMLREETARADELLRIAQRVAAKTVDTSMGSSGDPKKAGKVFASARLLRPIVRGFLARIAHARGAMCNEPPLADESAAREECLALAGTWCEMAPDMIACTQFTDAIVTLMTSAWHASKALVRCAKQVESALDDWPKEWRAGKRGGRRIALADLERAVAAVMGARPAPNGFDELNGDEFNARVRRELARLEQAALKRRTFMARSKGAYRMAVRAVCSPPCFFPDCCC